MTVSTEREEYCKNEKKWKLVRDVTESNVTSYIRDVDKRDPDRNIRYKNDAQFTNFTSRTKSGLVGAVFRKDLVVDLPSDIEYVRDDATGFKVSLSKLAQKITGEVLITGRYGLLVDYPASEDGLTAQEVSDMDLRARIYTYSAESIINWQVKLVNGSPKLLLVVLKECVNDLSDDGFTWVENHQYRVLRMVNGGYTQSIYDKDEELIDVMIPRDKNGNAWDYIPFVFVGSEDNDSEIDSIPLYDLANLNIGHLKNSADYEESVFLVGQPTLVIGTEMSSEQFKDANPGGVLFGSRRGLNLGVAGHANLLQAAPNQLADVAMQRKEEQAVMMGARLVMVQADRETAVAARMRHSGETSILSTIAHNVQDALIQCMKFLNRFMSGQDSLDGVHLVINDHFFDENVDPNALMAQIQLFNSKIIAKSDIRQYLRATGVVEETRNDDEIEADISANPPEEIDSTVGIDTL